MLPRSQLNCKLFPEWRSRELWLLYQCMGRFDKNCDQNHLRTQCARVITCKISETEVILLFTVCQVLELTAHTANYRDHLQLQLKSYRKAAAAFSVSTKGREREEWIYFSRNYPGCFVISFLCISLSSSRINYAVKQFLSTKALNWLINVGAVTAFRTNSFALSRLDVEPNSPFLQLQLEWTRVKPVKDTELSVSMGVTCCLNWIRTSRIALDVFYINWSSCSEFLLLVYGLYFIDQDCGFLGI